jgi:tetratricopeptide (TPR) repeat protein
MKKTALAFLVLFMVIPLFGEDFFETRTDNYLIKSTLSSELSAQTGYILEQLYVLFTDLTGKPENIMAPLTVIELNSKENFDDYLDRVWSIGSETYLLINQGQTGYSEIVLYRQNGALHLKELIHLAVFQFLEACNRETPFWLKEGLARYFETATLNNDKSGEIPFNWEIYEEYINREKSIPLNILFSMSEEELIENSALTYPECWAFTQYLLDSTGPESRLLWDYLSLIRTGRVAEWPIINSNQWEDKYSAYMISLESYPSLEDELKSLFLKDYYTRALNLIKDSGAEESWLGLYYTGLIHYERGLYEDSLADFTLALEKGGPEDAMKYAMGLSNLELRKREQGIKLLKEAKELNESLIPRALSPLLE